MRTIDAQELAGMIERGERFMLINVLGEEAFRSHHIPGSRNVPLDSEDFVERVEQMAGGKDQPIVVYCANEQCTASPQAADRLAEAGFTQVVDFEGGMEAWEQAKHPVEKGPNV